MGTHVERRRHERAGEEAITDQRIEIVRARPQTLEMELGALARGDDERGRPRAVRLRQRHASRDGERVGHARHGVVTLGRAARGEVPVRDRDAQSGEPAFELIGTRLGRPRAAHGIRGVGPLQDVEGQREIARAPRERTDVVEARREEDGACT